MACYYPLQGWRGKNRTANGKRPIVFKLGDALVDRPVTIACGRCSGCRLDRSRQWAIRCYHEAQCHLENAFITLTYNPASLPLDGSVHLREFQLFMKRLRKKYGPGIRYFACGEYGEKLSRPHYHACLFGLDFTDKRFHKETKNGDQLFTSHELNKIWSDPVTKYPLGHAYIGDVTFQSAAYVARYIMKKINGELASDHYQNVDDLSGAKTKLNPEFVVMSKGNAKSGTNGLGHDWLIKNDFEPYPDDFVVINGKTVKPPRYYDELYKLHHPEAYKKLLHKRAQGALSNKENNTSNRHGVREKVHNAKMTLLPRTYEEGYLD